MASSVKTFFCELQSQKSSQPILKRESPIPKLKSAGGSSSLSSSSSPDSAVKILLQPRLCTLRSYGSDRAGFMKTRRDSDISPFFVSLSDYIENSRKSQDFEIISGRLAMIVFAATVTMELVTGNTLFRKMDIQGIAEAAGACLAAIICAATFAWFSSARNRVDRIFTINCNSFIDSLIDQLIDGLFYESELSDWSDDI